MKCTDDIPTTMGETQRDRESGTKRDIQVPTHSCNLAAMLFWSSRLTSIISLSYSTHIATHQRTFLNNITSYIHYTHYTMTQYIATCNNRPFFHVRNTKLTIHTSTTSLSIHLICYPRFQLPKLISIFSDNLPTNHPSHSQIYPPILLTDIPLPTQQLYSPILIHPHTHSFIPPPFAHALRPSSPRTASLQC